MAYPVLSERRDAASPAAQTASSRPTQTLSNYATEEVTAESAPALINKFEQALAIVRPSADKSGAARLMNNLGRLYGDTGEYQKSLDRYGAALTLWRATGDKVGEADTLNDLGVVYDLLGDRQQALTAYRQALALRRSLGDRPGTAAVLNNIGLIHNASGDYKQALDFYRQALPLWREARDRAGEATVLNNTGLAYSGLGEHRQALSYYQQALPLWQSLSDRRGILTTQNNIAMTYTNLGEFEPAVQLYKEVRGAKSRLGDPSRKANTLFGYARAERDSGELLSARALIAEAIDIAESLRGRIVNRELRNSYFALIQGYYEFYIDLLMRLHRQSPKDGHDAAALAVNERARPRPVRNLDRGPHRHPRGC
jgi:tetratricopeptide (TPR) repeat protein